MLTFDSFTDLMKMLAWPGKTPNLADYGDCYCGENPDGLCVYCVESNLLTVFDWDYVRSQTFTGRCGKLHAPDSILSVDCVRTDDGISSNEDEVVRMVADLLNK